MTAKSGAGSRGGIRATALAAGRVVIENVRPQVEGGRYRAKAIAGEAVAVSARIFRDGPEMIAAALLVRGPGKRTWSETPLAPLGNDEWRGEFTPDTMGRWLFRIEGWTDRFVTWRDGLAKKVEAGVDVSVEVEEGRLLLAQVVGDLPAARQAAVAEAIRDVESGPATAAAARLLHPDLAAALAPWPDRSGSTTSTTLEIEAERERARAGAWYEFFPRSTGRPGRHGTFATAAERLPPIADMGFDVVYLPPIHPIGVTNRKGKNNALSAQRSDVGSPWAIGSADGGHTAVHPELGTIEDFDAFVAAAERNGLEVALDFAIQCSPDHPWVREHPEWFHHRPDGSIKHAENPPKKYEDIYPINFDTPDKEGLWLALKGVIDFWISHGVRIFRVDNPHTKPFAFWEWLIDTTRREHPDVVYLSEAFTRPAVMNVLAKLGFSQSYTYFTWRNTKWEIMEYLSELAHTESADYFRPNFFTNTPDILHEYLQVGGLPAFKVRLALAALLSPSYGIYSGYELFERVPVRAGSEEYLNSEKYELRHRDWDAPGTLVPYIKRINDIRRKTPSLARLTNLVWHHVDNDRMLAFSKAAEGSDTVLAVVNLNPVHWEEATVHLDLAALGVDPAGAFRVHDLITDETFLWHGSANYARLDPFAEPAHIFRIEA